MPGRGLHAPKSVRYTAPTLCPFFGHCFPTCAAAEFGVEERRLAVEQPAPLTRAHLHRRVSNWTSLEHEEEGHLAAALP